MVGTHQAWIRFLLRISENALKGDMELDIKIITLGELHELACKGLILSINTSSSVGKVAFGQVRNAKSASFLEVNRKVAWNRLVIKYAPHTTSSLLKLKSKFHNSNLESIKKDQDDWISNLEGLRIHMCEFGQNGSFTDKDFMILFLNNFPKEYDVILDGLKNCLLASGDNALIIEVIHEK